MKLLLQARTNADPKTNANKRKTDMADSVPMLKKDGAIQATSNAIGTKQRMMISVPNNAVLYVLFAASTSPFCKSIVRNLDTELLTESITNTI